MAKAMKILAHLLREKVTHSNPDLYFTACDMYAQSCLTLCNPMDCIPLGCSVHGISLARNTGVGSFHKLKISFF